MRVSSLYERGKEEKIKCASDRSFTTHKPLQSLRILKMQIAISCDPRSSRIPATIRFLAQYFLCLAPVSRSAPELTVLHFRLRLLNDGTVHVSRSHTSHAHVFGRPQHLCIAKQQCCGVSHCTTLGEQRNFSDTTKAHASITSCMCLYL